MQRELRRREREFRITVLWYVFEEATYERHPVYDTPMPGGKTYAAGQTIPAFWLIDEDDPELIEPEGRDPRKTIRFGVRASVFQNRGLSVEPEDRHGDRFRYEGQVYEVQGFGPHGHVGEPELETTVAVMGVRLEPGDTPYETDEDAIP